MTNIFRRDMFGEMKSNQKIITQGSAEDNREEDSIIVGHDSQHDEIAKEELEEEENCTKKMTELFTESMP